MSPSTADEAARATTQLRTHRRAKTNSSLLWVMRGNLQAAQLHCHIRQPGQHGSHWRTLQALRAWPTAATAHPPGRPAAPAHTPLCMFRPARTACRPKRKKGAPTRSQLAMLHRLRCRQAGATRPTMQPACGCALRTRAPCGQPRPAATVEPSRSRCPGREVVAAEFACTPRRPLPLLRRRRGRGRRILGERKCSSGQKKGQAEKR